MAKNLVVVESPAKAKTINKFLGNEYLVKASMGHVRDLPKSKLGVDVEHNFEPHYITIRTRTKLLKELKDLAKKSKHVYLATDPDREGEAIGWHLAEELKNKNNEVSRILFNEITQRAIQHAVANPRPINMDLVNAQQARRVLDRLFGYSLSPLLWKNVRRGLSAGRVQSVALRLIVEREREIEAFVPQEYWEVEVTLEAAKGRFKAKLWALEGKKIETLVGEKAQQVARELPGLNYRVGEINRKEQKRNPAPPFTTSKMQQEAARKLRFTAKKTMMIAQQLYEGLELGAEGAVGLITYMRTDSVRVSQEAQVEARQLISSRWGQDYLPEKPPFYKSKGEAQDAHEAIRPTSALRDPKDIAQYLSGDQLKLYRLIWQRFVASQMVPAVFDLTNVEIAADKGGQAGYASFKTNGSVVKFPGFMAVYTEAKDEDKPEAEEEDEHMLPEMQDQEKLKYLECSPSQHFTQPPPRYNDASLIKALEEKNIGRPSTYAPTVSTILDRGYVERMEGARLKPSELGKITTDLLTKHFEDIINVEFTAKMEESLDRIEEGQQDWKKSVEEFYAPFKKELDAASEHMPNLKAEVEVETQIPCDKCGAMMKVKWGRHGKFLACPNYPACKNTKAMQEDAEGRIQEKVEDKLDEKCKKCGNPMVYKQGRFGRFIACSNYPACKNTRAILQEVGIDCPKGCGGKVVQKRSKRGRAFFGCSSYPKCDFVSWGKPVAKECPSCHAKYLTEKTTKKDGTFLICATEGCGYRETPAAAGAAS